MDSLLGFGVALIGIFVALHSVTLMIVVNRLVKMPLCKPVIFPIQRSAVDEVLPVLDTVQEELLQQGFRYMNTRQVRSLIAVEGMPPSFCDVYYHAGHDIHAEVFLAATPTPVRLCDIYLWNTFEDGSSLLTVNGLRHILMPYPRDVRLADGYAPDLAGQIATHLHARLPIESARTNPADAPELAKKMTDELLIRLEKEKHIYRRGGPSRDPVYGFRFLAAFKLAVTMRLAAMKIKKTRKPAAVAAPSPDFELARAVAERMAFVRTLCTLQGLRAPRWYRRTVFILSAAAFLGLGAWWWGFAGAIAIAAVIIVHEAGHWMAMKKAGFRDVQVFFVPGMGGATSGEKHEASPMTHLMVYLAGPLPGLLLSLALFAWVTMGPTQSNDTWYPVLLTAAVVAFFINAINLLPVLPLDGGRVVELLLVGRMPWLRFIFSVASGAVLLAVGFSTGDNVMRAIGIVMLIGSQHHYRVAKASALMLKQKMVNPSAEVTFSSAVKQLQDFLTQADFKKWTYPTKVAVGQALLPRIRGRLPSWKESIAGLSVYAACALVPLAAMAGLLVMEPGRMLGAIGQGSSALFGNAIDADKSDVVSTPVDQVAMRKARRLQRDTALNATSVQSERLASFQHAINDAREDDDQDDALRLARMFRLETATTPPLSRERAEAAITFADVMASGENDAAIVAYEVGRLRQEAEEILRQRLVTKSDKNDATLLAQILEARAAGQDASAMVSMRQEIARLYAAHMEQSDFLLTDARRNLAQALDQAGQAEAAENEMRLAVADLEKLPNDQTKNFIRTIQRDMAWMLIAHRKGGEAVELVRPDLIGGEADSESSTIHQREARWVMLMAARMSGDWSETKKLAVAIRDTKAPSTGTWAVDFYLSRLKPVRDQRATLMLIEAERALGQNDAAEKLVTEMRKSYSASDNRKPPKEIACKMRIYASSRRQDLQQVLSAIEQRELKCLPSADGEATLAG